MTPAMRTCIQVAAVLAVIAALPLARADDAPESIIRPPKVVLAPALGWRLSAIAMMDVVDGVPVLIVAGDVINAAQMERASPKLRLTLRDKADRELKSWTTNTTEPRIRPGDYSPYETRLERPPPEMHSVAIDTIEVED